MDGVQGFLTPTPLSLLASGATRISEPEQPLNAVQGTLLFRAGLRFEARCAG